MWCRFRVSTSRILFVILSVSNGYPVGFAISNFNASIRDYAQQDGNNSSQVRTLQKEGTIAPFPYGGFLPTHNPIQYKEVPDNALSSSSHSRGLAHHEHGGYGLQDYEDGAGQFEHGGGYNHRDFDHYAHGYNGHVGFGHGHVDHHEGFGYGGHHHKHYGHGLSAKLFLPVAGLALLGAAAALVSNPILLQLGVVSGRRRRDTSEVTSGPDFDLSALNNWQSKSASREDHIVRRSNQDKRVEDHINKLNSKLRGHKGGSHAVTKIENEITHVSTQSEGHGRDLKGQYKGLRNKKLLLQRLPFRQSSVEAVTLDAQTDDNYEDGFIPVALKWKKSNN